MQVPIDSVTVPERVRKDLGDLQPLMDSLKRVGQLHPIRLTPTYELISGHRRLTAAGNLGWKTIEAEIVAGLDETRRLEMELEENIYRKDFTPDEVLEGWKRLDALKHPTVGRRIRKAIGRFFGRLAFWKRRARKAEAELAEAKKDDAPAAELPAPAAPPEAEPAAGDSDENLGV